MIYVEICVGSSCHLKGSTEIVEFFQNKVAENNLDGEVVLAGSFCTGKCNRIGTTVTVNDEVFTGLTADKMEEFWKEQILANVSEEMK